MSSRTPLPTRTAARLLSAAALTVVAACSFLTGVDEPDELTLELSGDADQLTLVTSTFFVLIPDPECPQECERLVELVAADTTVISPPFERTYRFTSRQQYFIEVWPTDGEAATVTMKVDIDGRTWYDDFRQLLSPAPGEEQRTIRFVYNFRELVI